MSKKEYTQIPIRVKSVDGNSLWAIMSTDDQDRHGDEVPQNWNLDNFMNNPVVLNGHQYDDTTEAIGRVEAIIQKEHSLEGKVRFATEENPKAKVIFDLYKGGFLNAFSVGFIPGEEPELLELSAVSVPANAMALAKAKGINTEALDEKDVQDYSELTVEQLKELLREKELKVSGRKQELVERIKEADEELEKEEEVEEKEEEVEEEQVEEEDKEEEEEIEKEDEEEEDEEEEEVMKETAEEIKEMYKKDKSEQIKSAIVRVHQELAETHADNLSIKKKKIHKIVRSIEV